MKLFILSGLYQKPSLLLNVIVRLLSNVFKAPGLIAQAQVMDTLALDVLRSR